MVVNHVTGRTKDGIFTFITQGEEIGTFWGSQILQVCISCLSGSKKQKQKRDTGWRNKTFLRWVNWWRVVVKFPLKHDICLFFCLPAAGMKGFKEVCYALEIENSETLQSCSHNYRKKKNLNQSFFWKKSSRKRRSIVKIF